MKFRTKVLVVIFSLILVTGGVTTIMSQRISESIVKRQIYDHLETTAQSRARHIETFVRTEKETIKQLSEDTVIERLLLADRCDQDYVQKYSDATRRLVRTAKTVGYIYDLFILNRDGVIVASSEEADVGKEKSNNPYFLGAKEGTSVKDAYVSSDKKRNTLAFSAPVYDEEHIILLGVVVARISMGEVDRITTDRTGLGETGEIYLVNKNGYMITPSRFADNTFLKQRIDTENRKNCSKKAEHLRSGKHEHEPVLCKNYLGKNVLGVHAHIPEIGWCLLAEMSQEEALAPVVGLTRTMLLILSVLLVGGIVIAIVLSRVVTGPIVKLHHGTEEIMKGSLNYRVGTGAKDEIGQLSRAFDKMAISLKQSREELKEYSGGFEKGIGERTVELREQFKRSEEQRIATQNILQDLDKTNVDLKSEITERKKAEKVQTSIYGISEAAHSAENLEGLFCSIHEIISKLMPAKNFYIALYDVATETLSFPYFIDEHDKTPAPKKLGRGMTEYVLRTGKPLLASPEVFEQLVMEGEIEIIGQPSVDWLGVPLKTKDKTVGVLVVQSYTEGIRFEEKDKDVLTFVSTQVAMAIERKQTEEALKQAKAELEELNLQLEDKVKERTQELKETQEKLIDSERLAAIGQLAANIAHELRHPLAILQNSAYFLDLKMKGDDEKVKKHLAIMKKETLRADGIISALLSFSRKMESHFVPIELNEVIDRVLSKMTAPQDVEVVRDLGDIPAVFADGEQLQSIFVNLISNGIQAMPDGGTLKIETSRDDGFVRVEVSDTGVGIPKRNLVRIFEPLFSTKSFGVGLGLCITKRLIENHGGTIEVQSKLNVGSTFIMRIPVERRKGR